MSEPSDNELDLRRSLGRFATGVAVVTCCDDGGSPCGITANSFSSVSLDPPLVLWNIAKVSNSLDAYLGAEYFAVHILKDDQQYLSAHFATTDHTIYNGIDYEISARRVPILPDVLARFDCATRDIYDTGDHHIVIGEVLSHAANSGSPLLFYGGEYMNRGS